MIQASELRIGNYVGSESNSIFDGRIRGLINALEVVSIDSKGINAWQDHGASGIVKFEELFGLPLTEEWLIKFGFYKSGNWFMLSLEEFSNEIGVTIKHSTLSIGNSEDDVIFQKSFPKYVHQLQNLYFTLTGKELELKKENNAPSN